MANRIPPFNARQAKTEEQHAALAKGVPPWLVSSLWSFVTAGITTTNYRKFLVPNSDVIQTIERRVKVALPIALNTIGPTYSELAALFKQDPILFLAVAEEVANRGAGRPATLGLLLDEAGSAYELGEVVETPGKARFILLERVDPAVRQRYESVLTKAGKAGQYLQEAWQYVYQLKPDPGAGYRKAVAAVEAAAIPICCPTNLKKATLGSAIAELRDPKKAFEVHVKFNEGSGVSTVQSLCELLWKGQLDRHGNSDPDAPLNVTKDAAEMALHGAITLVHWFSSGAVTLKP